MKLITRLSNSTLAKSSTFVSLVSILAVIGPIVIVSAGFWDAISHLQKEPIQQKCLNTLIGLHQLQLQILIKMDI